MLFSLFALLVGYVSFSADHPVACANFLRTLPLTAYAFQVKAGRAHFRCLLWSKRRLEKAFAAQGISLSDGRIGGLPGFFWRYRSRVGAFLGALVCVTLTYLSSQFIWQIEVVGNRELSDGEVLAMLAKEGVYEGAYTQNIDPLAAANRCVMHNDALSFMSVNIVGNHVEAVVGEAADKVIEKNDPTPSNVVAAKDGVIRRIELESGVAVAYEGKVVHKGELLISGVNLLRDESYHYQPAKGQVLAETLNEVTLSESLLYEEKVYTGAVFEEKTYIFFTKSKKVSKDSGNLPANCDRIETKERIMLFGKIALPIWISRVEYRAFVFEEKTRSEAEAKAALYRRAGALLLFGEVVSREDAYRFDGEKATLTVRYRLIENIAEDLPLFETP